MLRTTQGITLDVIIEALFGVQDPTTVAQFHHDILQVVESFSPLIALFKFLQRDFGGFGPWARFQRNVTTLNTSLRELIAAKDPVQINFSLSSISSFELHRIGAAYEVIRTLWIARPGAPDEHRIPGIGLRQQL